MIRLIFLIVLLLPAFAFAQEGILTRDDCGDLTPVTLKTECLQLTNASGRIAGRTYIHNGTVWVEKSAITVVNAQTGTTYTVLNSDSRKLVTFSNGSAVAVTLPQAGASSEFMTGWFTDVQNRGAGTVTITPTTSTIDGAASLALTTNQGVRIFSDGTNYFTQRGVGSATGGASGAPDSAQYIVGGAHGSLTAERVATDTATIDVDLGTAGQAKFNVIQSAPYSFTGRIEVSGEFQPPSGTFAQLPATPEANDRFTVTDCLTETCEAGGGSGDIKKELRYDAAEGWQVWNSSGGVSAEADTLETVMGRGNTTTKCTAADPCEFSNAADVQAIQLIVDDTNVAKIKSRVPADLEPTIPSGLKYCLRYEGDGACIETIDPTQAAMIDAYEYHADYRPIEQITFRADALYKNASSTCADPSSVRINSGPQVPSVICTNDAASQLDGSIRMPKNWDGGPVIFEISYVQTAVNTGSFISLIQAQCRAPGGTINNTFGTPVAITDAAVTGSNGFDVTASTAVTPNGSCAGGNFLAFEWFVDISTTTTMASLHILEITMLYNVTSRSN